MNRRRRASSIASRATDDEIESSPVEHTRKKRRVDPVYVISNRTFFIHYNIIIRNIYSLIYVCEIIIIVTMYANKQAQIGPTDIRCDSSSLWTGCFST